MVAYLVNNTTHRKAISFIVQFLYMNGCESTSKYPDTGINESSSTIEFKTPHSGFVYFLLLVPQLSKAWKPCYGGGNVILLTTGVLPSGAEQRGIKSQCGGLQVGELSHLLNVCIWIPGKYTMRSPLTVKVRVSILLRLIRHSGFIYNIQYRDTTYQVGSVLTSWFEVID